MNYYLHYPSNGKEKSVSLPYSSLSAALRNAETILQKEFKDIHPIDYFITDGDTITFCNITSNYLAHKQDLESKFKQPFVQKEEKKKNDKKWVSRILWTLRQHYLNAKPLNKL